MQQHPIIAIDARMITRRAMHGIARYVFELLVRLKRYGGEFHFKVLVKKDSPLHDLSWPSHISLQEVTADWISFREQWELPQILKSVGADLLHSPSFVAPVLCPCRLIMTIHDLNHVVLSQFYTFFHQLYYRAVVRHCVRRCARVITVSEFSKGEIVSKLGVDKELIEVTYNGVSENYRVVEDATMQAYVRDLYELPERYILSLSNNKPHKNLTQLVRAYCYSDLEVPLVIASKADRNLIQLAEYYGKKHKVYFTQYIEEEHLPVVYSMAEVFVYPSTYEGFGLPPLEAMACGTPVIASSASSLPEVVGNQGIYVNPNDYVSIGRALEQAVQLRTSGWALRRSKGIEHARCFSWDKMVEQTMDIYRSSTQVSGSEA